MKHVLRNLTMAALLASFGIGTALAQVTVTVPAPQQPQQVKQAEKFKHKKEKQYKHAKKSVKAKRDAATKPVIVVK